MNTNEEENLKIVIPAYREHLLQEKFEEMRKRAKKLKLDWKVSYEVLRRFSTYTTEVDGWGDRYRKEHPKIEIQVEGETLKLNGWSLLGRLDFVSIPGQTLRAMVPGVECPAEFQDVEETRCDACHVSRQRNDVFLLQNEDGRTAVVGRTCLKDYLGHVSPEAVAYALAFVSELVAFGGDDDAFYGARGREYWPLHGVLAYAAYSIRVAGWASAKANSPTKEHVIWLLTSKSKEARAESAEMRASDSEKATATTEWLKTLKDNDEGNDYLHNLAALGEAEAVSLKTMGLAVSAIVAHARVLEREVKRRQRAEINKDSNFVGAVKDRLELEVTLEFTRQWETNYGFTTLYSFRDTNGNVLVWKASRDQELNPGDKIRIKGTVKEHKVYEMKSGDTVKQTALTRCKVLERLAA